MSDPATTPQRREVVARLEAAADRLREAHFFLHGLEDYYHHAEPLRWHLNAFLRPLKEVTQLVSMAVQNDRELVSWHRARAAELRADPLVAYLGDKRDFLVHRGMLLASSSASLGITEGRGMKLGIGIPLDPRLDSDAAMRAVVDRAAEHADLLGILDLDDEDSLPAVERTWFLDLFPDTELIDLRAEAWLKVANYFGDLLDKAGIDADRPTLECRHSSDGVRVRVYEREALRRGDVQGFSLHPRWASPMGQYPVPTDEEG